jgi:outer membrane protein assembly factor BamB
MSDSTNGALISWRYADDMGNVDSAGLIDMTSSSLTYLPLIFSDGYRTVELTSSSGTAYVDESDANGDNGALTAIDINTGTRLWSGYRNAFRVEVETALHLVAVDYDDNYTQSTLVEISGSGGVLASTPLPFIWGPTLVVRGQGPARYRCQWSGDRGGHSGLLKQP